MLRTTVKWADSIRDRFEHGSSRKGTAMAKSPPDLVMTIAELSKYLKISRSTLYKLAQEGKLPAQKVGRHWRFHREAVDEWLRQGSGPTAAEKRGAEK